MLRNGAEEGKEMEKEKSRDPSGSNLTDILQHKVQNLQGGYGGFKCLRRRPQLVERFFPVYGIT